MSKQSEAVLGKASTGREAPALLVLEDGTAYAGRSCAAQGEAFGEICFDTSMIGYEDVIIDPAYTGGIVTMTYPQVGNYGISRSGLGGRKPSLRGMVVHLMCRTPSNWQCEASLPDYLEEEGVVAIEGIDTRSLTRHVRGHDRQGAAISTIDLDPRSLLARLRERRTGAGQGSATGKGGE